MFLNLFTANKCSDIIITHREKQAETGKSEDAFVCLTLWKVGGSKM